MNSPQLALSTSINTSILRQGLIVNPSKNEQKQANCNSIIELVGEEGFFTALIRKV
ncbi:MAG: hypothetical protein AB4058_20995 [Microcystaceae cyanobacterium]